jgi:hemoglobin
MIHKHDIRNDDDVEKLVHTFYSKVRKDERLGYIFNDFARVSWDHHLPRMVDFWSNLLFQTNRYDGKPYHKHTPLPIEKQDFFLWFTLFEETVDQLFAGERADHAKEMAGRIASSFSIRMEMDGKFESSL